MRSESKLVLAFAALAMQFAACATNPVSGKRELAMISEAQEIEMGREADREVTQSIGLYPDDRWQRYVQEFGSRLAAETERPNLPWTFRVVDDSSVNAFAIPGGFRLRDTRHPGAHELGGRAGFGAGPRDRRTSRRATRSARCRSKRSPSSGSGWR